MTAHPPLPPPPHIKLWRDRPLKRGIFVCHLQARPGGPELLTIKLCRFPPEFIPAKAGTVMTDRRGWLVKKISPVFNLGIFFVILYAVL
jgi:hypothetical protein